MRIKIISNPITPYGDFSRGQELTDQKYPTAFLIHLVEQAGAAEYMDKEAYQTKIIEVEIKKEFPTANDINALVEEINKECGDKLVFKKKLPSSPSSQQAKASGKKTSKKRMKKRKS